MRRAITLARRHGSEKLEIIQTNTVPFADQLRDFKERVAGGKENADFAEVQLWVSDSGVTKAAKFQPIKPEPKKK